MRPAREHNNVIVVLCVMGAPCGGHYRRCNYKFRSITAINDAYVLEFAIGFRNLLLFARAHCQRASRECYTRDYGRVSAREHHDNRDYYPFRAGITGNTCTVC